jgi:aminopeptidase N
LKPGARIRREDYRPPDFRVEQVHLAFDIREQTTVTAKMSFRRTPEAAPDASLVLDGRGLELQSVALDGRPLAPADYTCTKTQLTLTAVPEHFGLTVVTRIDPESNTSLEGLYRSGPMLCTQCEAHGFSRITYYLDRPDVLARFRVRIEADRARFPVLLANGDCVEQGEAPEGRHYAVWEDPFPKPCYLFALVAGDLACVEDTVTTASGRQVRLQFYVDAGNKGRVPHALQSLKNAMRWDEQHYGLEYDLDTYMVVAARDFNMGAMENKGLNLFNAAYVLASPETATDADYEAIEAVIGHEYFHNWTGNRVTCRDWFQLSLKEGLTVFREQQFSAAMGSAAVKRIQDVRMLRARQFPEDAGPLAHPVRPDAYVEVNNFYTATVYEKGAELIRMIETMVGPQKFTEGVREYLRRHDGTAATIEDFLQAHESVSGTKLDGFRRWYAQAGTPVLEVSDEYRADEQVYTLRLRQHTPPTPGQPGKAPVPIPVRFQLLDSEGRRQRIADLRRIHPNAGRHSDATVIHSSQIRGDDLFVLEGESAEIRFEGVALRPTPSLLRGFSAPVVLRYPYSDPQLALLLRSDDDAFVRWSAVQQLVLRCFEQELADASSEVTRRLLIGALSSLAAHPETDRALLAELLRLPAEAYVLEQIDRADPARVGAIHDGLRGDIARALTGPLSVWAQWEPEGHGADAVARRALGNLALAYLAWTRSESVLNLCLRRVRDSRNMTLVQGALAALRDVPCIQREQAYDAYYVRSRDDSLMLDKWFALQSGARRPDAVAAVRALLEHEAFDARNPNRVRSVLGPFSRDNPRAFHAPDGSGYRLLAEQITRYDAANPQLASRLFDVFMNWRRLPEALGTLMRGQIEAFAAREGLSPDVREKVEKALV